MSHSTIIKTMPQHDLINELRFFIKGASEKERCNPVDLTKSAVTLLRCLPASRVAVFEYFSKVFDKAARNYIDAIETEIKTGVIPPIPESDQIIISDVHTVLISVVNEDPVAWAPLISSWSLDLLGETSSKYAGRAHFSSSEYIT